MEYSIKSKLKELFNHSFIYGLTSSLQSILGFVLLPILTKYYSTEEFGVYSIILLVSSFASAVFYFGASSALGRFYYDIDSDKYRREIISASLFVTIVGAILLAIISFFGAEQLSFLFFQTYKYYLHIRYALIGTAFGFLLNTMTLILRYQKQSWLFMIISLIGVFINFTVTITLLLYYNYGILAPIIGTLVSTCLTFLFLLIKKLSYLTVKFDNKYLRQIIVIGLQISITSLLYIIVDLIDKFIIKDLMSLSDVGIYSLGFRLGSVIHILLIVPFSMVWAPMRMQYSKNENNMQFVSRVFSYFSIIGFIGILFTILFGNELMLFLFNNKSFFGALKVFPIIMLSVLFIGFVNILDFGIYLKKKFVFYIVISIIGIIINVVLNYLFIPSFGYIAAAFVKLFTSIFIASATYIISYQYYKLSIEWRRVVLPFIIVLFLYYISFETSFFDQYTILKKIVLSSILIALFLKMWLSENEYNTIKKILK